MSWYIDDLARFRDERRAIADLEFRSDWLTHGRWGFDPQMRLLYEADISIGEEIRSITLRYPDFFPHSPPLVLPRGDDSRWSAHQYGPGGELCLEFGPDNWTTDVTGAQMIESAHRLLAGEVPTDTGKGSIVPSRHDETLGQKVRNAVVRFLITRNVSEIFSSIPIDTPVMLDLVTAYHSDTCINVISGASMEGRENWVNPEISRELKQNYYDGKAPLIRIPENDSFPPADTKQAFQTWATAHGCTADKLYTVVLKGIEIRCYRFREENDCVTVTVLMPQPAAQRLDDEHSALIGKTIGLIGCGSLGSKIGASLCRSGVTRFKLIDDDVLFPDNLVRNELDWRDIGAHKASALAGRLSLINAAVETTVMKQKLGGQESSASIESVIANFQGCDLLIDATANPSVFNLLAALPDKPLIWGEVFGGGFGGLIARYRPGKEPDPLIMRRAIENWFAERSEGKPAPLIEYGVNQEGKPLIADDADVTAIAAHTARLALDLLMRPDASNYPNSVYAIGMGEGSVFTQPFHTHPIEVGPALAKGPKEILSQENAAKEIAAIVEIFVNQNETSTTNLADPPPAA